MSKRLEHLVKETMNDQETRLINCDELLDTIQSQQSFMKCKLNHCEIPLHTQQDY